MSSELFSSFFLGGFDCCTQYTPTGKRLDMLATTKHDLYVKQDYARLQELGICAVRDGVRWHLVEAEPGKYDFSSLLPVVKAARETKTQVIYDLCHYGWPDDIDLFSSEFITRYSRYGKAVVEFLTNEGDDNLFVVPINEISFWSWGAADCGCLHPFHRGRGWELKTQLVRAAIEGIEAIWAVNPKTRVLHVDPVVSIVADPDRPEDQEPAETRRLAMYQSWDMLSGRLAPELGGNERYLDIIGVNFYPHNQWTFHNNETLARSDPRFKPFRQFLAEVYERYGRPILVSETGAIGEARADWLTYVADEGRAAIQAGIPVEGICLYPLINYPGWDDGKLYEHGLWGDPDASGRRQTYEPLEDELRRQIGLMRG